MDDRDILSLTDEQFDRRLSIEQDLWNAVSTLDVVALPKILRLKPDLSIKNRDGMTLLHLAVESESISINQSEDRKASGVPSTDRYGHDIAVNGTVVKLLLAAGADRLAVDSHGRTPFEYARDLGHSTALVLLECP